MSMRTTIKSLQKIMWPDVGVDGDAQRIDQLCWLFFLKIVDDQDQELELLSDNYRSPIPDRLQWRNWAADPEGMTGDDLLSFVNDDLFPSLNSIASTADKRARRIPECQQLHEVWSVDASADQQDQRHQFQRSCGAAAFRGDV